MSSFGWSPVGETHSVSVALLIESFPVLWVSVSCVVGLSETLSGSVEVDGRWGELLVGSSASMLARDREEINWRLSHIIRK